MAFSIIRQIMRPITVLSAFSVLIARIVFNDILTNFNSVPRMEKNLTH